MIPTLALLASGIAHAHGPFASFGVSTTGPKVIAGVDFTPYLGPTVRAGYEFGDRWNQEVALQWSHSSSHSTSGDIDLDVEFATYAVGYRFSVDFLGKKGFTPYVGTGVYLGMADLSVTGEQAGYQATQGASPVFLELHAAVGARYTLESGLNFRVEVAGSTYGGLFALQPSLGGGFQF